MSRPMTIVPQPRAAALACGDVTLANIHPPARERILARYGADR